MSDTLFQESDETHSLYRGDDTYWKENKIRLEQILCNHEEAFSALNHVLSLIKSITRKKNSSVTSCFISYAWPHEQYQEEMWLQTFIENLNRHLIQAGILTFLDRRNNRVGGSVYGFIEQLEKSQNVIVVGSRSLLLKHKIGKSNICAELNKIKEKSNKNIFPILLCGDVNNSYPEWFSGYTNVVDWRNDSYVLNLKELIRALYKFEPDDENYANCWFQFEKENSELAKGLHKEVVLKLLEKEKELNTIDIKKSQDFFFSKLNHSQVEEENKNHRQKNCLLSNGNTNSNEHGFKITGKNFLHPLQYSKYLKLFFSLIGVLTISFIAHNFNKNYTFLSFNQLHSLFFSKFSAKMSSIDNKGLIPEIINPVIRGKIYEIYNQTKQSANELVYLAITGFPGTGKTVFSELYADLYFKNQNDFPKKLRWFIRAERESTRIEDYSNLAKNLNINFSVDLPLDKLIAKVTEKLLEYPGFILIFDNVIDYKGIMHLIPNKPGLKGQIVLTSQNKNILPFDQKPNNISLSLNDGMTESESLELFRKLTGYPPNDSARTLINRLGGIPLALSQAASFMAKSKIDFGNYLANYEKEFRNILTKEALPLEYKNSKETPEILALKSKNTYDTIFRFSLNSLTPEAEEILFLSAYMATENIPVSVFRFLNLTEEKLFTILNELEGFSLINLNRNKDFFSVHRVVQDMAKVVLQEKKLIVNLNSLCINKTLNLLHRELTANILTEHDYYYKRYLIPHLESILNNKEAQDAYTKVVMQGIFDLGLLYKSIGNARLALFHYQKILPYLINSEDIFAAEVNKGLGRAYQSLGDFNEAKNSFERSYKVFLTLDKSNSPEIAEILNDLGMVSRDLGAEIEQQKPDQGRSHFLIAEGYLIKAIEVARSLPYQNKNLIRYRTNLGEVYRKLKNLDRAKDQLEEALKIAQVEFPNEKHRLVASAYFGLGNVFMNKKEYQLAKLYFSKAVTISSNEDVAGSMHPLTARHMDALGLAWKMIGNENEACQCFKNAHTILMKSGLGQKQLVEQIYKHMSSCSEPENE